MKVPQKYCRNCNNKRFTFPEGKPEFTGPCSECNPKGELPYENDPKPKKAQAPSDDDIFPFGTNKGKKYGDIRASYFTWLADQDWLSQWPQVKAYIDENWDALEEEAGA